MEDKKAKEEIKRKEGGIKGRIERIEMKVKKKDDKIRI